MQEIPELARVFLFVDSVSLLDFARVPIVPTSEDAQPIIGQPAPLFSHVPAELLPLAFVSIGRQAEDPRQEGAKFAPLDSQRDEPTS